MYELRYYQKDAVDAVFQHLREDKFNQPCIVLPTGSGKSLCIAEIASQAVSRWGGRVLVLTHVKELIEQNTEKIRLHNPALDVGIYSAGLGSKQTDNAVLVAGIQSVYRKALTLGFFNIIMIDECHLLSENADTMYGEFFTKTRLINPKVRIIGLTATPYRLKSGMICAHENILNTICYEIGIRELMEKGYLCKLTCKASLAKFDEGGLHRRMGEFIDAELAERLDTAEAVSGAVSEILEYTIKNRNSILIFCINIAHAEHVKTELLVRGQQSVALVSSLTSKEERDSILKRFKSGELKYICNVSVLTTGFDAPNIDCVVMLRPTASCGLYYQIVGRGFRICEGKENCLILDFAGNVMRLGAVDDLHPEAKEKKDSPWQAPMKECEKCRELVPISIKICPACGAEFPIVDTVAHGIKAGLEEILSGTIKRDEVITEIKNVKEINYYSHGKSGKNSLCVEYTVESKADFMSSEVVREFICFEHGGYAREKAVEWFNAFVKGKNKTPDKTEGVMVLGKKDFSGFIKPDQIRVKKDMNTKYWGITSYYINGERIKF